MLQLVAGLTVAFVGYVLYEVFKTVSQVNNQQPTASGPAPKAVEPPELAVVNEPAATAAVEEAPIQHAEPAEAEPSAPAEAAAADTDDKGVQLRNPATGETCAVPNSYRFAKKWVKEALVEEKLLDRVYKASELDENASRKVKDAIEKLRAIPKYHG
jgi:hypothetical protein